MTGLPHAEGAILTDWEGEAVEHFCYGDPFRLKVIGAHKGIILGRLKELHASRGGAEAIESVVIRTGEAQLAVGAVGPDYALVILTGRDTLMGQTLHRMRHTVALLEKEIY